MSSIRNLAAEAVEKIRMGDVESAIDIYRLAVTGDAPWQTYYEFGLLLHKCYQFDAAVEQFQTVIEKQDVPVAALQTIAKQYFSIGRFSAAAMVMRSAIEQSASHDADCLEQLAGCLERNNQTEEAAEIAHRALKIDPSSVPAIRLLAHIDKRAGKFETAVDRLSNRLTATSSENDWMLQYELASSLDRLGEYDSAWDALVEAKDQLRTATAPHLKRSYEIRKRQGELSKRITDIDFKRWREARIPDSQPQRITLLAGFPRSGTTLLEQILTAHSDCIGTDETGILTSQFIDQLVWSAGDDIDALIELRGFDAEDITRGQSQYVDFTESFIGEPIGDRLLIEKDPLLTCDLPVPLRLFPQASILMPLRDPRDVALSYFFTILPIGWNSAPSTTISETARFYHDVMRHWLLLRDRLPYPFLETRYDELVSNPNVEARRITDFLGLDWQPDVLDVSKRSSDKAIRTPTYDDVAKPLYTRAIGRWKNYERQMEPALEILNQYASEFGFQ